MQIPNGFDEFFCLRSNLSNDNIISAQRPGLKTGVEDNIFWSEMGLETDGTTPPRVTRSTPRPGAVFNSFRCEFLWIQIGLSELQNLVVLQFRVMSSHRAKNASQQAF